jgi:hypothetical protein
MVKGISSALIVRDPEIFAFATAGQPSGFGKVAGGWFKFRPDEPALDEATEHYDRVRVRQVVPSILENRLLDGFHGLPGMVDAPVEVGNGFDQGFRIVFFRRAHNRMITSFIMR